jgi:hypothetical protein
MASISPSVQRGSLAPPIDKRQDDHGLADGEPVTRESAAITRALTISS